MRASSTGRRNSLATHPVFTHDEFADRKDTTEWVDRLAVETRARLAPLVPFSGAERRFLHALQERGEIVPELLTTDRALQARIRSHPGLKWKCHHVRRQLDSDREARHGEEPSELEAEP